MQRGYFSISERQVLTSTALRTDGGCFCAADCEIAINPQHDLKSFLLRCLRYVFLFMS